MGDEYLATGFAGLDRAADPQAYVACLRLLGRTPGMRAIKDASLERLGIRPGARSLEVGCGLGVEAAAMARLAGPGGLAAALDLSWRMLVCAAQKAAGEAGGALCPVAGDGLRLPFAADVFDACRVERTLQHVADPGDVLAEMVRVVRPGGVVVAVEPDWGAFVVDSRFRDVSRALAAFWCDSFRCGWIGRRLARHMAEAGLGGITVSPCSLVVDTLEAAEAVYNLEATARRAVAAGNVSAAEARAFLAEQRSLDAAGRFFCSLTFFLASGVKPQPAGA